MLKWNAVLILLERIESQPNTYKAASFGEDIFASTRYHTLSHSQLRPQKHVIFHFFSLTSLNADWSLKTNIAAYDKKCKQNKTVDKWPNYYSYLERWTLSQEEFTLWENYSYVKPIIHKLDIHHCIDCDLKLLVSCPCFTLGYLFCSTFVVV